MRSSMSRSATVALLAATLLVVAHLRPAEAVRESYKIRPYQPDSLASALNLLRKFTPSRLNLAQKCERYAILLQDFKSMTQISIADLGISPQRAGYRIRVDVETLRDLYIQAIEELQKGHIEQSLLDLVECLRAKYWAVDSKARSFLNQNDIKTLVEQYKSVMDQPMEILIEAEAKHPDLAGGQLHPALKQTLTDLYNGDEAKLELHFPTPEEEEEEEEEKPTEAPQAAAVAQTYATGGQSTAGAYASSGANTDQAAGDATSAAQAVASAQSGQGNAAAAANAQGDHAAALADAHGNDASALANADGNQAAAQADASGANAAALASASGDDANALANARGENANALANASGSNSAALANADGDNVAALANASGDNASALANAQGNNAAAQANAYGVNSAALANAQGNNANAASYARGPNAAALANANANQGGSASSVAQAYGSGTASAGAFAGGAEQPPAEHEETGAELSDEEREFLNDVKSNLVAVSHGLPANAELPDRCLAYSKITSGEEEKLKQPNRAQEIVDEIVGNISARPQAPAVGQEQQAFVPEKEVRDSFLVVLDAYAIEELGESLWVDMLDCVAAWQEVDPEIKVYMQNII